MTVWQVVNGMDENIAVIFRNNFFNLSKEMFINLQSFIFRVDNAFIFKNVYIFIKFCVVTRCLFLCCIIPFKISWHQSPYPQEKS